MKKLLLILLCMPLIFSCGENEKEEKNQERVLMDELTKKGETMYHDSEPFNGIGFDVFDNGELDFEQEYKYGKRHGLFKRWPNKHLYVESYYEDGKMHGKYKEFYNDQLILEGSYKEDKKEGVFKRCSREGGQLLLEEHYKAGDIISTKEWYVNGQIKSHSSNIWKGNGFRKEWYENGKIKLEGSNKDGWKIGIWREWNENGTLRSEENHYNGFGN